MSNPKFVDGCFSEKVVDVADDKEDLKQYHEIRNKIQSEEYQKELAKIVQKLRRRKNRT